MYLTEIISVQLWRLSRQIGRIKLYHTEQICWIYVLIEIQIASNVLTSAL